MSRWQVIWAIAMIVLLVGNLNINGSCFTTGFFRSSGQIADASYAVNADDVTWGTSKLPPIVIVTGLGGACGRGPTAALKSAGFNVRYHTQDEMDCEVPVETRIIQDLIERNNTINYKVDKLDQSTVDQFKNGIRRLVDKNNCNKEVCVFKEEQYLFMLPFFQAVFTQDEKRRLCIVHHFRDPVTYSLQHNWLSMFRWYKALLGEELPKDWQRTKDWMPSLLLRFQGQIAHRYTYESKSLLRKAQYWDAAMRETLTWMSQSAQEPLVRNFVWRCRLDRTEAFARAVAAECGGARLETHAQSSSISKFTTAWEAEHLGNRTKGKISDISKKQLFKVLSEIGNITKLTAQRLGLLTESSEFYMRAASELELDISTQSLSSTSQAATQPESNAIPN